MAERIREAGGAIYAVTSEPQRLAERAQADWELAFDSVGDPHHEVAETAREKGWLDLHVQSRLEFLQRSTQHFEPTHPKGYFQPGVLVVSREGRVLYRWRSVPSRKNIGGATVRPTAEHVWASVESALQAGSSGTDVAHDERPEMDAPEAPWPLFVALLIANGWFVRPRAFAFKKNGPTTEQRIRRAGLRLAAFALLWVAAFAWLPTLPVVAALAAWAAWITPRIVWVNREFQNLAAG